MHRHKDGVRPDQGYPKVNAPQALIHHAAKHFWKPVICCGEDAEDRSDTHNEVKVANHKVRVVQRNIQHRLCQEWSAQAA